MVFVKITPPRRTLFLICFTIALSACRVDFSADRRADYPFGGNFRPGTGPEPFNSGLLVDKFGQDLHESYPEGRIYIKDSSFSEVIEWQLNPKNNYSKSREFWFWLPGQRNFCGGSTTPKCALDASFYKDQTQDSPIFSESLVFNIMSIDRPAECTPPGTLRDMIATVQSTGERGTETSAGVRLCDGQIYEGLKGPFDEPIRFARLYAGPGVILRNSDIETSIVIFSKDKKVNFENVRLRPNPDGPRVSVIKGLKLTGKSDIQVSINNAYESRSYEFSDIEVLDSSRLGVGVSYRDKGFESQADARSLTLNNIHVSSKPSEGVALEVGVFEGKLIIKNTVIRSQFWINNSTWYGYDVMLHKRSVDISAARCTLGHFTFNGGSPCDEDDVADYFTNA